MKKSHILLPLFLSFVFIAAQNGVAEVQNKDRSGTPDGSNVCSQCHNSGSFAPEANLEVTDMNGLVVQSYEPGQTYLLSISSSSTNGNASEYGFQMTVLTEELDNAGEFLNPGVQVQIGNVDNDNVMDRNVLEHSSPTTSGSWESEWTAPSEPSGLITFYYSSVAANGNNLSTSDSYAGGTLELTPSSGSLVEERSSSEISMIRSELGLGFFSNEIITSLEVYSTTGRLVFMEENLEDNFLVKNADLPSGIVLVVVRNKSSQKTFKTVLN